MLVKKPNPSRRRSSTLNVASVDPLELWLRAADYLAAAQIYLKANPLLEEPLKLEHVKDRLLGHFGTTPGITRVCGHLNRLIQKTSARFLLVTGPGHGAAANYASLFLEGTLSEFFPDLPRNREGIGELLRRFSWPYGLPSHLSPDVPGVIHEGGELGYALATSFGAALDAPQRIVVCIVGDGEAETGPTATAWHGTKFLNPKTDGAVLPILLLNGFKIANPSLFASMTEEQITQFFESHGYAPRFVHYEKFFEPDMDRALEEAYAAIRAIQSTANGKPSRPRWPVIILQTPKGLGCPKEVDGKPIEGNFRAHQVPIKEPKKDRAHLQLLEKWLRSYRPQELFDREGRPIAAIQALAPPHGLSVAREPGAHGLELRALDLPSLTEFAFDVKKRGQRESHMKALGAYLREVVKRNARARNFRIVCPDELESNKLGAVLDVTSRQFQWPVPAGTEKTTTDGRVLEMLSEHQCQGWLQGYVLTGRHGLFPCYEAFIPIIDGMMNQFAKFLKASREVKWRQPVPSLNYLLTSESWRQDHNGYSHQGPGFINNLLTKKGQTYRIYLPPDSNCLLSAMDHCLRSRNYVNLVIAAKQEMPQWLSLEEAIEHCRIGASIWRFAGNHGGDAPEVILACCGDNPTLEIMAAARLLEKDCPDWRIRVVNVTDLTSIGIPEKYPHGIEEVRFQRLFPLDVPVIFHFHGYTAAIKQLLWERPGDDRFEIHGYREEGSTTTPFDMQIRNRASRFHAVMRVARQMAKTRPAESARCEDLIRHYEAKLRAHREYVVKYGIDPKDIDSIVG